MILLVVFIPLVAGLLCLLLNRGLRIIPVLTYLFTAAVAVTTLLMDLQLHVHLLGSYGISLVLDRTAAWFLLLNAVVCMAVAWHERPLGRHHYFFILLAILHGCLNASFVSGDLLNLYVVIELTTIVAFLMIGQGMRTRQLWNALRYLMLSNVGMLFFLLGTLMVYEATGSFALTGVPEAPAVARGMIMTGLLFKGGVFLPGLWLPQAHAEAETSVSALLSGVVVKIGLLPLLRLAILSPEMGSHIRFLGLCSVFIGLGLAFFQRDYKRLLACSTISQVGFILIAPVAGAIYAFAHGVAKACLFLCAGSLKDRDLLRLKELGVGRATAWPMVLSALSIAGCPLLAGGYAKYMVSGAVSGGIFWCATVASIGTAAILTPLILLPHRKGKWKGAFKWQGPVLLASVLLIFGVAFGPYSLIAWLKAVGLIVAGYLLHRSGLKRLATIPLPDGWERLEHVVGMACVMLLLVVMAEALL